MVTTTGFVFCFAYLITFVLATPLKYPHSNSTTTGFTTLSDRREGRFCGGIRRAESPDQPYSLVKGRWTIPKIDLRHDQAVNTGDDNNLHPNIPIWVGLDGSACGGALLQAGTVTTLYEDGPKTDFFVEFWPYLSEFQGWTVNTGDEVSVQIVVTTETTGIVIIENITQGQTKVLQQTAPPGKKICRPDLEWLVEYSGCGLPDFDTFTLTATGDDSYGNAKGAEEWTVEVDGTQYCTGSIDGDGNVAFHAS